MAETKKLEKEAERKIKGAKFYPVHLTNEEIRLIITSFLHRTDLAESTHYQVFIRKDKSSKGLDLRFQNSKGMYADNYLLSYSISPHWKLTDVFIHKISGRANGRNKIVDVFNSEGEDEILNVEESKLDAIFIARLVNPERPYRNLIFERDDWVCVMEKNDVLADTPYTE